jgi:pimeloyl-ACP methyl ester carboxylesterase
MVDMRGHGKSEAPESGYSLENLAIELASLIQVLGFEKPILLGHSLGAITSLVLAGLQPDLPHAIMLVDPPAFWCHDASDPMGIKTRKSLSAWIHAIKRKTKEELMEEARTKGWTEADQATWVNAKQRASLRVVDLISPTDILTIDFPSLVSRIYCPVLLVQGDLDRGAICTDEDIAKLRAIFPPLQTVHIRNGTHSIHRSQLIPFMEAVESYFYELQLD